MTGDISSRHLCAWRTTVTRAQIEEAERRRIFGQALAAARRQANLTQKELAATLALTVDRVGDLERGQARPAREEVGALLKIFPGLAEAAQHLRLFPRIISDRRPLVPGQPAGAFASKKPEPIR
jgi:DNA-binding transcriptional regulator YiaG